MSAGSTASRLTHRGERQLELACPCVDTMFERVMTHAEPHDVEVRTRPVIARMVGLDSDKPQGTTSASRGVDNLSAHPIQISRRRLTRA